MSLKPQTLSQFAFATQPSPLDLGDGLILRTATPDDTDALAKFNAANLGNDPIDEAFVGAWTRDLISETHPAVGPTNVFIVEDTRARKIVSSLCLIPQMWTYGGIPFGVGRTEAVSTDPDYRNRGLVRELFKALHAKSEALGHLVQGVTGIPYFYRQFGYEYAIDLGGGKQTLFASLPTLKESEPEPYRLRAMTVDDIPFAARLYARDGARSLVVCPRDESFWRFLLTGYSPDSFEYRHYRIIETTDGRAMGYLSASPETWWNHFLGVVEIAFDEGAPVRAAMPAVLRALKVIVDAQGAQQKKDLGGIMFACGREHPVYEAVPELFTRARTPSGWFIRVPDVPKFIRHIAPVLESRLAQSTMAEYTGEIKLNEYRGGLRLAFENGRLTNVQAWTPVVKEADGGFPPLVFLQLLFGRHAIIELREFYPDVWAKDDAAVLLGALFPKQSSCVIPVG